MNNPPENPAIGKYRACYERLRISDRARLSVALRRLSSGNVPPDASAVFEAKLEDALKRSLYDVSLNMRFSYPEELPVSAKKDEIKRLIASNKVVIVCGSTGSGKTTQLPKIAIEAGCGKTGMIGITQPRRIAASSLAARVAEEFSVALGSEVGYKVRFDDHTSGKTLVKFMTDGILLAESASDRDLLQYDCIILDEVHERSLNVDFLLGCLKLLLRRRDNLKLVISSATLDAGKLSSFFGNAPVAEVEGRLYPVEDVYLPPAEEEELAESVARGVEHVSSVDLRGDMLVFLPGEREIRECSDMLEGRKYPNTEILPLFGRLSSGEQKKVFSRSGKRRIVLATNVAETSVTIPGIRFVVDSGLVRLSRYNPRSRIQELLVENISRASAKQRRGRCGRLRDGVCVHLYSKEDLEKSDEFTPPEIQRSSLAGVILQMAALNLPPPGDFPFVDEPESAQVREGYRTLEDIGAVRGAGHTVTRIGRILASMPLDPHLGKMLVDASERKVLSEMLVVCSFLSIQDVRERPFEKAAAADQAHRQFASEVSDYLGILKLWCALSAVYNEKGSNQALKRYAVKNFLNYRRIREWRNLADDLRESCSENGFHCSMKIDFDTVNADALHQAVMSGIPRQLACYDRENGNYHDISGKHFIIFPGSGLSKRKSPPQWLLPFTVVETTRVFARCCAEVKPEWLEKIAPHLCKFVYDSEQWDERSGFVYARERVTAGTLIIHPGRRRHYGSINPPKAREIFIREALVEGRTFLRGTWLEKYSRTILRIRELEIRSRRPGFLLDSEAVFGHFDSVLPSGMNSIDSVAKAWRADGKDYSPAPEDIVTDEYSSIRPDDYPDSIEIGGTACRLQYVCDPGGEDDGATLFIPRDLLNLAGSSLPEYCVPGYLREKTGFLLRSLPKAKRNPLMPLDESAGAFVDACRAGAVRTDEPLSESLAAFLNENYDLFSVVKPEDIERASAPDYLTLRIAVTGENGRILRVCREMPLDMCVSSSVGRSVAAAGKWTLSGCAAWPGLDAMPEKVELSRNGGACAYPAIEAEDGGTFGRRLFTKRIEAVASHRHGLAELAVSSLGKQVRLLKNSLSVPRQIDLALFMDYRDWKDDLVEAGVLSFGDPWKVRSSGDFERMLGNVRTGLGDVLEKYMRTFDGVFEKYLVAEKLYRRLPEGSFTEMDVSAQLSSLFRSGFMKTPEMFMRYDRYMKALCVRLERAVNFPSKDEQKGRGLSSFTGKLALALEDTPDAGANPELVEFFQLVEEARINRYSPEIPVLAKCSDAVLAEAWEIVSL